MGTSLRLGDYDLDGELELLVGAPGQQHERRVRGTAQGGGCLEVRVPGEWVGRWSRRPSGLEVDHAHHGQLTDHRTQHPDRCRRTSGALLVLVDRHDDAHSLGHVRRSGSHDDRLDVVVIP